MGGHPHWIGIGSQYAWGGGYWTAVGGHPHWIGIGSQYAWGGGVVDGGGRAPPFDWHRLTVRVGGGGTGRRWEGTPIGLA